MTFDSTPGGSDVINPSGYSSLTVLDQPAVPCVVVRVNDFPMRDLGALFDAAFGELGRIIADAGLEIVAPALAVYFRLAGKDVESTLTDVAVGFPVSGTLETPVPLANQSIDSFTLEASGYNLPSGRIAVLTHTGPYGDMQATWNDLITTVTARGLEPLTPVWEVYVTQPAPGVDPATLRTDLYAPLAVLHPSR